MLATGRVRQGLALIRSGLAEVVPEELPGREAASLAALCAVTESPEKRRQR